MERSGLATRAIAAAGAVLALGAPLGTGIATATAAPVDTQATAAPVDTQATSSTASGSVDVTFSLLDPNAAVTFTVAGQVVGTGTTNANGDVSFHYDTSGLAPGYYELIATTVNGATSRVGFTVR